LPRLGKTPELLSAPRRRRVGARPTGASRTARFPSSAMIAAFVQLRTDPTMTLRPLLPALAAALVAGFACAAHADDAAALAAAAQEPGAVKTASGLVYKSIKEGTGASPAATDIVKVNYAGTLPDGKKFDASADHGGPISFPLNRVIPCWTEGVQKMKVGGKAKLTCPSAIAYGSKGAGGVIPPDATLVFEVELVAIQGK
jgi:FKBP-type peptidyl-prolyl cis-trans isomerase FkpA